MENNKYTYAIYIDNIYYFWGAIGFYFSLKEVDSKYPLHIIIGGELSQNYLDILDELKINYSIHKPLYFNGYYTNRFAATLGKFYAFDLIQYDKVFLFDADVLLYKNFDFFFNYNFNIFCSQLEVGVLNGTCFLIQPNKDIFNNIINNYNNHDNDEQVLNILFLDYSIKNRFSNIKNILDNVYHCGGDGKYWSYYSEEEGKEKIMNLEELKVFVKNKIFIKRKGENRTWENILNE